MAPIVFWLLTYGMFSFPFLSIPFLSCHGVLNKGVYVTARKKGAEIDAKHCGLDG